FGDPGPADRRHPRGRDPQRRRQQLHGDGGQHGGRNIRRGALGPSHHPPAHGPPACAPPPPPTSTEPANGDSASVSVNLAVTVLAPLFTGGNDTVDFATVTAGNYIAGPQNDGVGGA